VNLPQCSFFWTGDSSVDVYVMHSGNSLVHIQVIMGFRKSYFRVLNLIGELISPLAYSVNSRLILLVANVTLLYF